MKNNRRKILIISHNCLSLSGSNGRTMRNLLYNIADVDFAQFYICPEKPDYVVL